MMKNKKVNIYDFKIDKTTLDTRFTYMDSYTEARNTEVCNKIVYYKTLNFYINNMSKDHYIVSKKLVFYNKTVISFDIMRYRNFEFCKQANIILTTDDPKVRKIYKKILRKFKRYNCNILQYKIKINKNFINGLTNDYL